MPQGRIGQVAGRQVAHTVGRLDRHGRPGEGVIRPAVPHDALDKGRAGVRFPDGGEEARRLLAPIVAQKVELAVDLAAAVPRRVGRGNPDAAQDRLADLARDVDAEMLPRAFGVEGVAQDGRLGGGHGINPATGAIELLRLTAHAPGGLQPPRRNAGLPLPILDDVPLPELAETEASHGRRRNRARGGVDRELIIGGAVEVVGVRPPPAQAEEVHKVGAGQNDLRVIDCPGGQVLAAGRGGRRHAGVHLDQGHLTGKLLLVAALGAQVAAAVEIGQVGHPSVALPVGAVGGGDVVDQRCVGRRAAVAAARTAVAGHGEPHRPQAEVKAVGVGVPHAAPDAHPRRGAETEVVGIGPPFEDAPPVGENPGTVGHEGVADALGRRLDFPPFGLGFAAAFAVMDHAVGKAGILGPSPAGVGVCADAAEPLAVADARAADVADLRRVHPRHATLNLEVGRGDDARVAFGIGEAVSRVATVLDDVVKPVGNGGDDAAVEGVGEGADGGGAVAHRREIHEVLRPGVGQRVLPGAAEDDLDPGFRDLRVALDGNQFGQPPGVLVVVVVLEVGHLLRAVLEEVGVEQGHDVLGALDPGDAAPDGFGEFAVVLDEGEEPVIGARQVRPLDGLIMPSTMLMRQVAPVVILRVRCDVEKLVRRGEGGQRVCKMDQLQGAVAGVVHVPTKDIASPQVRADIRLHDAHVVHQRRLDRPPERRKVVDTPLLAGHATPPAGNVEGQTGIGFVRLKVLARVEEGFLVRPVRHESPRRDDVDAQPVAGDIQPPGRSPTVVALSAGQLAAGEEAARLEIRGGVGIGLAAAVVGVDRRQVAPDDVVATATPLAEGLLLGPGGVDLAHGLDARRDNAGGQKVLPSALACGLQPGLRIGLPVGGQRVRVQENPLALAGALGAFAQDVVNIHVVYQKVHGGVRVKRHLGAEGATVLDVEEELAEGVEVVRAALAEDIAVDAPVRAVIDSHFEDQVLRPVLDVLRFEGGDDPNDIETDRQFADRQPKRRPAGPETYDGNGRARLAGPLHRRGLALEHILHRFGELLPGCCRNAGQLDRLEVADERPVVVRIHGIDVTLAVHAKVLDGAGVVEELRLVPDGPLLVIRAGMARNRRRGKAGHVLPVADVLQFVRRRGRHPLREGGDSGKSPQEERTTAQPFRHWMPSGRWSLNAAWICVASATALYQSAQKRFYHKVVVGSREATSSPARSLQERPRNARTLLQPSAPVRPAESPYLRPCVHRRGRRRRWR